MISISKIGSRLNEFLQLSNRRSVFASPILTSAILIVSWIALGNLSFAFAQSATITNFVAEVNGFGTQINVVNNIRTVVYVPTANLKAYADITITNNTGNVLYCQVWTLVDSTVHDLSYVVVQPNSSWGATTKSGYLHQQTGGDHTVTWNVFRAEDGILTTLESEYILFKE